MQNEESESIVQKIERSENSVTIEIARKYLCDEKENGLDNSFFERNRSGTRLFSSVLEYYRYAINSLQEGDLQLLRFCRIRTMGFTIEK